MQFDRPLLSIAIPTFNRSHFLAELLAVLKPQMDDSGLVELIISDNASTDDTQPMLEGFSSQGLKFRYIRNKTNLGPDRNILQCFEEARGIYVWIFGDDDIILPGAIDKIIRLLRPQQHDLIFLRPYEFFKDYQLERQDDPTDHMALIVREPKVFAEMVGVMFTFISGMIVNKKRFSEIPHLSCSAFCDTYLIQLAWVFPLLSASRSGLFVFEPLIAGRGENSGNYSLCQVFGKNLKRLCNELLPQDPLLGSIVINDVLRQWFPSVVLKLRRSKAGNFSPEDVDCMLRPLFSDNFRYWLFVLPLVNTPLWFAKIWQYFGKSLNRGRLLCLKIYRAVYLRDSYLQIASPR
jgi:abequosyltransferase